MGRQPLQPSSNNNANVAGPSAAVNGGSRHEKTIEETYQKKSQLEHILLRPDTYVGSIEKHTQTLWVYENDKMVCRSVSYCPGLYKIFDEILVNAADNKQRDPTMDSLKVSISVEDNCISVYNNGDGVPVEIHQEEQVYVPELIFGHLLTSSNYDDTVKKTTGGRNGYGAKLANIFSTEFIIETADGKRQRRYKQVFRNNMGSKSEPVIAKCKGENWTKVTFKPDLVKFNMTYLEDDVVALMKKRVVDLAGCLGKSVKVELNGQKVPIKTFQDYVGLYLKAVQKDGVDAPTRIHEKVNDRWEVCVSLSDGQFQQVSFVNSISTIKGGSHVDYIAGQITTHLIELVKKKNKNAPVKAHTVKNHLWIFVNCLIDNPAFDSQTKETLTTRQNSFGSKCELPPEFLKKVAKSGVVDSILTWADIKQSKDLKKTDGAKKNKITGIDKLEDAHQAGNSNSHKCTLIVTEGDSAKALAMAGRSVVGGDLYGVYPLRGKLLNVREASHKQILENNEIKELKTILGLRQEKKYENVKEVKELRYGHLMIMTDQDHDGSHIKGLLINFIHTFWPGLLKSPSFLLEFITPIVKATHKNGTILSFYSMPEYESWKESVQSSKSWSIKYYKGLGTSTSKEGKEYFKNLNRHRKDFMWSSEQDGDAIELAFSKKKVEDRKNWLRQFEPGTYLNSNERMIKYSDFVNKELILFSMADLQRSIPSMVDGLKPGQRKILFCAFKRKFEKEAKIAQFSGYVSEHSAYHHGEQSLASTIIGMAQDYVGSNNINLLAPLGQFGTRDQGGKDHASARYIFTCLSKITRKIFPDQDDALLDYMNEDGLKIEPTWYVPIIPMVLVNGSEGIGTGWSSFVPNYNPRDIIANLRRLLNGEPMIPMDPWYKGFKGTIERTGVRENGGASYTVSGIIEQIDVRTLRITELPIRKWTQDYKRFLESLQNGTEKIKEPFILDFTASSTDTRVHFDVVLSEENMKIALAEGLLKKFKLTTTISTTNMHLFDSKGTIQRYESPEQILQAFYPIRFEYYEKRKKVLLDYLQLELRKLDNKVRFILGVVSGEIVVSNRKRSDLVMELKNKGFDPFPKKGKSVEENVAGAIPSQSEDTVEEDNTEEVKGVKASDYEYLLSMAIGTLTLEKVQELCNQRDNAKAEYEALLGATPKTLWLRDLDAFEEALNKQAEEEAKDDEEELRNMPPEHAKVFRNVGKNQRKNAGKAPSVASASVASQSSSSVTAQNPLKETGKGKRGGGGRKGAPKKIPDVVIDEEEEDLDAGLQDRLAAYNEGSSPDASMNVDAIIPPPREPSRRAKNANLVYVDEDDKEEHARIDTIPEAENEEDEGRPAAPNKNAAAKGRGRKKAMIVDSDSDADFTNLDEDSDSEFEEPTHKNKGAKKTAGGGGGGKKQAKNIKPPKVSAPIAAAPAQRKRGPAKKTGGQSQKLIEDMLTKLTFAEENNKPTDPSPYKKSPEKKVRRMRQSPFNKKSGAMLSKLNEGGSSSASGSSTQGSSNSPEEGTEPARFNRPQRASRAAPVRYVIDDDDESDEEEIVVDDDTDDSDF